VTSNDTRLKNRVLQYTKWSTGSHRLSYAVYLKVCMKVWKLSY